MSFSHVQGDIQSQLPVLSTVNSGEKVAMCESSHIATSSPELKSPHQLKGRHQIRRPVPYSFGNLTNHSRFVAIDSSTNLPCLHRQFGLLKPSEATSLWLIHKTKLTYWLIGYHRIFSLMDALGCFSLPETRISSNLKAQRPSQNQRVATPQLALFRVDALRSMEIQ